ncbi:MAG: PAS domain S-box protein [Betaproteobacteria bacterium]|nr:PAS domain S-box protein [Betaproteobacteria bacterium]
MERELKILMMEDAAVDAELVMRELKHSGIACVSRRVETREDFIHELRDFAPDVVLCDFTLPGFSGLAALAIAKEFSPDTPCILISGTIGEETAIESLKCGATDYILKTNLTRLPSAVQRAMREQKDRLAYREAEQALAGSEERFRLLWETTTDAVVLLDSDSRIQYANPAVKEIFGYDAAELAGQDLAVIQPERLRQAHRQGFKRYLATLVKTLNWRGTQVPALHRDGHEFLVELAFSHMTIGGKPVFAAFIRDVTERERAAAELRASDERFRQMAENIKEAFWLTDPTYMKALYVSPAHEEIWGRSKEDLSNMVAEWFAFIHPEDRPRMLEVIERSAHRSGYVEEYRIVRPDGSVRWISDKAFPVFDDEGRIVRIAGISDDITERKLAEHRLQESEAKYRQLIEQATDGIVITNIHGNYILVNTTACELLGYTESELLGMNGWQTYLEEERQMYGERLEQVRAGKVLRIERMMRRKDGSAFPAEVSIKMLDNGMIQLIIRDITDRRAQELKISRLSRIHAVLSGINAVIVRIRDRGELFQEACRIIVEHGHFSLGWIAVLDHATGKLMAVAQAGLPENSGAGSAFFNGAVGLVPAGTAEVALREKHSATDNVIEDAPGLMDAEHEPDTLKVRRAAIELGAKSVIVLPLVVERETFGILTLYASERNFFDDEEIKLLNELAGDISFGLEFIAKEEKVDYLAYYDALTGLPNRSLFFDRLTHQLGSAARDGSNVALLLIDLDRFRQVNDTLGRQSGDALLAAVAERLNSTVRDRDSLARVSSNRFALAISGISDSPDVAHALESRNREWFERPFTVSGEELRISATAGIAMFPDDGENAEALFANAEAALRLAKAQSAPFLFYGPEMNARVAESLRLETRLRRAIANQELVLWYQPKIDLKTGKITGMEALMRWRDPESGLVPPGKFIPIMEQTGMILDAGNWALSQVAVECRLWTNHGLKPPRVAVNVSPIQLRQKDFVAKVKGAADETQAAGGALDLEITESVIMENVDAIIPKLQTIRGLGVETYIDDFGTGYSSLAYIARLPIHSLKIDRSFIVGMTQNEESLNIVNSVISLAHTLKLRVVAEGVETEAQSALLRHLECDEMQGFLFSPPVPPEEVPALLRRLA